METLLFDSIDSINKIYGFPTYHPLVTVVDLREASHIVNHVRIDYGVYALFLKNGSGCSIRYGRKEYDYQEGTVVSFAPGQLIEVDLDNGELSPDVIGLIFHPDLIYGTLLGQRIKSYAFFDYSQREALHLSRANVTYFSRQSRKSSAKSATPSTGTLPSSLPPTFIFFSNTSTDSTTASSSPATKSTPTSPPPLRATSGTTSKAANAPTAYPL